MDDEIEEYHQQDHSNLKFVYDEVPEKNDQEQVVLSEENRGSFRRWSSAVLVIILIGLLGGALWKCFGHTALNKIETSLPETDEVSMACSLIEAVSGTEETFTPGEEKQETAAVNVTEHTAETVIETITEHTAETTIETTAERITETVTVNTTETTTELITETEPEAVSDEENTENNSYISVFPERYMGALDAWQFTEPADADGIYHERFYSPLETTVDLTLFSSRSLTADTTNVCKGTILIADATDGRERIDFSSIDGEVEGWLHITDAPEIHTFQVVTATGELKNIYEIFTSEFYNLEMQKFESDINALKDQCEDGGLYYKMKFSEKQAVEHFLENQKTGGYKLPMEISNTMKTWFDGAQGSIYLFFCQLYGKNVISAQYSSETKTLYLLEEDINPDSTCWYVGTWEARKKVDIEHILEYDREGQILYDGCQKNH